MGLREATLLALIALAVSAAGCGGTPTEAGKPVPAPVTKSVEQPEKRVTLAEASETWSGPRGESVSPEEAAQVVDDFVSAYYSVDLAEGTIADSAMRVKQTVSPKVFAQLFAAKVPFLGLTWEELNDSPGVGDAGTAPMLGVTNYTNFGTYRNGLFERVTQAQDGSDTFLGAAEGTDKDGYQYDVSLDLSGSSGYKGVRHRFVVDPKLGVIVKIDPNYYDQSSSETFNKPVAWLQ